MRDSNTPRVRASRLLPSRRAAARGLLAISAVSGLLESRQGFVQAATITWGNSGSTFSTGANWIGGTAPGDNGNDIAVFTGTPSVQPFMSAASRNVGIVDFQSAGWTFTGNRLGFPSGPLPGQNGVTSSNGASGSVTFANTLLFSNNQTWTSSLDIAVNGTVTVNGTGGTRTFTFNGSPATSFAGAINFNGSCDFNSDPAAPVRLTTIDGIASVAFNNTITQTAPAGPVSLRIRNNTGVALLGSNSYSGTTELNAGALIISSDSSLGTAPGAFLANSITATSTTSSTSTLSLSATAGTVSLSANRGVTVSGNTSLTINTNGAANALVINSPIAEAASSTGRLTKIGAGTLVLNGSSSLTGTVNFSAGVLNVGTNNATGTGILRFGGGTLLAGGGPRSIGNSTILLTNASTVAGDQPITFTGIFTYDGTTDRSETFNNTAGVTINGGLILSSSTGARRLSWNGTGSTTIAGPITETPGNPGTFVVNNTGSTTLLSTSNSYTGGFELGNTGSTVILPSDNAMGTGTFTWVAGTVQSGAPRLIANPIAMIPTGTRTIGSPIEFSGPVTLSSTGLGSPTPRTVSVAASTTGTFSGVISDTDGTGLEKSGAGTLVLTGSNSYSGGTSFRNGILSVASNANLGAAAGSLSFDGGTLLTTAGIGSTRAISVVSAGAIDAGAANSTFGPVTSMVSSSLTKVGTGKLTLDGVRVGSLNVSAGAVAISAGRSTAKTSIVNSLNLAGSAGSWTSTLNLADQDAIVDYDALGPSPIATIGDQIASGYASATWTGTGIASSAAAANVSPFKTALGFAEASAVGVGTFSGQSVDGSAVLVRYTYSGDASLNGIVDSGDFTNLALNFNHSGKSWVDGDFNFDGVVNGLDFNSIASNYGQTLPSAAAGATALGALVPEPASMGAIGTIAIALKRRRRK